MAAAAKSESSNAQGRFVVSLPKEVGEQIDKLGAKIATAVTEQTGATVEITRAQVVQGLVKSALSQQDKKPETEAAPAAA